jgi:hypothetical protein
MDGMTRSTASLAVAALLAFPGRALAQDDGDPRGRTEAEPARALDDGSLRAVFLDLLGRPPYPEERAHWLGKGRHELCDALIGSEDFWRQWYEEQLYYFLLIDNFRPETERLRTTPAALAAGKLHVRDAIHRVALSSSFDLRNPGADTFVTVVLEQLTGMEVQANVRTLEIGKAIYDGEQGVLLGKTGHNQSDVVEIAIGHKMFAETFVEREYARLLRTEMERAELKDQARRFHKDPYAYTKLVRGWTLSAAYDERLANEVDIPNRLFVNALFVDLLGRLPTDEERRRVRSALDGLSDPGPLRSVLARLMIDSGKVPVPEREAIEDPTAWVADLFRRLLGREASEDELKAFVTAFHDPSCRPATVLYALVSHPEYHSY